MSSVVTSYSRFRFRTTVTGRTKKQSVEDSAADSSNSKPDNEWGTTRTCPLSSAIRSSRRMTCQAGVAWGAMAWRAPDLPLFIRLENVAVDVSHASAVLISYMNTQKENERARAWQKNKRGERNRVSVIERKENGTKRGRDKRREISRTSVPLRIQRSLQIAQIKFEDKRVECHQVWSQEIIWDH